MVRAFAHGAMCRWIDPSWVDPLSYFSFQPVLHDWCNKGRGMCYPVCGMVHIKEPLLLIHFLPRPLTVSNYRGSLSLAGSAQHIQIPITTAVKHVGGGIVKMEPVSPNHDLSTSPAQQQQRHRSPPPAPDEDAEPPEKRGRASAND